MEWPWKEGDSVWIRTIGWAFIIKAYVSGSAEVRDVNDTRWLVPVELMLECEAAFTEAMGVSDA